MSQFAQGEIVRYRYGHPQYSRQPAGTVLHPSDEQTGMTSVQFPNQPAPLEVPTDDLTELSTAELLVRHQLTTGQELHQLDSWKLHQ